MSVSFTAWGFSFTLRPEALQVLSRRGQSYHSCSAAGAACSSTEAGAGVLAVVTLIRLGSGSGAFGSTIVNTPLSIEAWIALSSTSSGSCTVRRNDLDLRFVFLTVPSSARSSCTSTFSADRVSTRWLSSSLTSSSPRPGRSAERRYSVGCSISWREGRKELRGDLRVARV